VAEVDEHDDRGDRQAVADDRERPRVAGIALVDEAADRAPLEVMCPAGEEQSYAAVRTAPADAAAQGRADHCTPVSVMSNSSVARSPGFTTAPVPTTGSVCVKTPADVGPGPVGVSEPQPAVSASSAIRGSIRLIRSVYTVRR